MTRPASTRLIPAWAGKTPSRALGARSRWAHPRVGGENFGVDCDDDVRAGSSPRGRGKLALAFFFIAVLRLIPAWAGKTCGPTRRSRLAAAHPRVGGENGTCSGSRPGVPGSSPRGRGKHALAVARLDSAGLIPAWAGKTRPGRRPPGLSRAHPRVGGENRAEIAAIQTRAGSSPRGRGKRRRM